MQRGQDKKGSYFVGAGRRHYYTKGDAKSRSKARKGAGVIDNIKKTCFFPPNRLPSDAKRVFEKYRRSIISAAQVGRQPISGFADKIINNYRFVDIIKFIKSICFKIISQSIN